MKKVLLFFVILVGVTQGKILKASQSKPCNKNSCFLKNGMSFETFERKFRERYFNLLIPEIQLMEKSESRYKDAKMFLGADNIEKMNIGSLEWDILHATGHHNKPWYSKNVSLVPWLAVHVRMIVGAKKIVDNYKCNIISPYSFIGKMAARAATSLVAYGICCHYRQRPSEYFADSFANKYASKEALQGGYDSHIKHKKEGRLFYNQQCMQYISQAIENEKQKLGRDLTVDEQQKWDNEKQKAVNGFPSIVYTLLHNMDDPAHPSSESRANRVAKAMESRFGVKPTV
ncbi:MAG: hypothetical protein WC747_04185 [Candidatus Babeliales bacterium]|jgi:hypothetical protein